MYDGSQMAVYVEKKMSMEMLDGQLETPPKLEEPKLKMLLGETAEKDSFVGTLLSFEVMGVVLTCVQSLLTILGGH
jgi:hypothetical protein